MKKKWLALLLASAMLFSVAACSDKGDDKDDKDEDDTEEVVEETTKKETTVEETTAETEPEIEGTAIDTTYWSAVIPDSFTYDEENFSDAETWGMHEFYNYDEEEEINLGELSVNVTSDDSLSYRKSLAKEVSLEDYANGALDVVNIGGIDFVTYEVMSWGETETKYFYRAESAGMSVTITVSGDMPDAQAFIDSMTLEFPDNGLVDAPYPWDGEMYKAETGTVEMGGVNFTATQLMASESFLPTDIFDNRIAVAGDLFYALDENELKIYTIDGDNLILNSEITLEDEYEDMCSDNNGNIYISGFGSPALKFNNGELVTTYSDVTHQFSVAPDGSFAIQYFNTPDSVEKIILNDDGTASLDESFTIDGSLISMISEINITENYILIAANTCNEDGESDKHCVCVFDYAGTAKYFLKGDPEGFNEGGLGSVTSAGETDDYIFAIDGNMREFLIWSKDGEWLGTTDDLELIGTDYPWISGLDIVDNVIYVSCIDDRPDNSWNEFIFFRINIG